MIFVRKELNSVPSVLGVDPITYAELVSDDLVTYRFNFTFSLNLKSPKGIENYDRVVVTVKSKTQGSPGDVKDFGSNEKSADSGKTLNYVSNFRDVRTLVSNASVEPPKLPSRVSEKVFSGLRMVNDAKYVEPKIAQKTIAIENQIRAATSDQFRVTEIYAPDFKDERQAWRKFTRPYVIRDKISSSAIDVTAILNIINRDLRDISEAVNDPYYGKFTSESDFNDIETILNQANIQANPPKPRFFYDITRYYLTEVSKSPEETKSTWYSTRKTIKKLDRVDITVDDVPIPKTNENEILDVRFELYKKNSTTPDEKLTIDLGVKRHVSAYKIVHTPPGVTFDSDGQKSYIINIKDRDASGVVKSFDVYLKSIDRRGIASSYRLVGRVNNDSTLKPFQVKVDSELSIVRVIPVDFFGRETNVFTNVVLGGGWNFFGNLTITPFHYGANGVQIQIHNVPKNAISATLFRRNCSDSAFNIFEDSPSVPMLSGVDAILTDYKTTKPNNIYEYYVKVTCADGTTATSPQVPYQIPDYSVNKGAYVAIGSQKTERLRDGYLEVEFEIKTTVDQSETQRLTELIKGNLKELYDNYLDPRSNLKSPLVAEGSGASYYADLFIHSVVRTNLRTGERETFPLQGDGIFRDDAVAQNKNGIKPINPQQEYVYQVFTYRKDPIELFKNYVALVEPADGSPSWFYLPYKWMSARSDGTLYADDDNGVPVIPKDALLTSVSYGLTNSFYLRGSAQFFDVTDVVAERIDRNTMKITWKSAGASIVNRVDAYDSFVVMKVVNGVRSFVGCTSKNYMYHELLESDLGSVYYVVIPIMSEFDIDSPAYSNSTVIDNEGLVPPVRVPS